MDWEMMEGRACCFIPNEVLVKHCKNCLDYFEEMDWNGMIFFHRNKGFASNSILMCNL